MPLPFDIGLDNLADFEPLPRFVKIVLNGAAMDNADEVVFVLDLPIEDKFRAEREKLLQQRRYDEAYSLNAPNTFSISFKIAGTKKDLHPCAGDLFEPFMRILLNTVEIPYWTKKHVSSEFETIRPASKWKLVSEDLKSAVRLERIDKFGEVG